METPVDTASPLKTFQSTECQYFVLSPRNSIESPKRRPRKGFPVATDENADHNSQRGKEGIKGGPPKSKTLGTSRSAAAAGGTPMSARGTPMSARGTPMSARGPARQQQQRVEQQRPQSARGRPSQVMACMRPATPTKKTGAAVEASSPQAGSPGHTLQMTPERVAGMLDLEEVHSFASTSVYSEMYSEMSTSSRLSQLSRKSATKKQPSSQELEQQKIEEKKRELKKLMKRNHMNSRKGKVPPTTHTKSTRVTVPKEFSLSAPATPRDRSASRRRDASSDIEDSVGSVRSVGSARSVASARSVRSGTHFVKAARSDAGDMSSTPASPATRKTTPSKSKPWRPQLTVPRGPRCSDVGLGRRRRSSSCPPEDCASDSGSSAFGEHLSTCSRSSSKISPEDLAERRRQVYAATAEAQRQRIKASATKKHATQHQEKPAAQKKSPSTEGQIPAATDAEARAQRAREMAMRKKDEEAAKEKERHSLFRRPGGARASQQTQSEADASKASHRATPRVAAGSAASASAEAKTPRTTPRKHEGSETPRDTERPMSARQRRPSFGSTAARF